MECVNGIVNCSHLNVYVLDMNVRRGANFNSFLMGFLEVMVRGVGVVRQYPKLEEGLLEFVSGANKEILDYIYDDPERKLSVLYNQLLVGIHELTL